MNEFLFWRQFYNQVFDDLGFDDGASLHPAREILCYEANCAALKNPFPRVITRTTNRDAPPSKMRRAYTDEQLQEVATWLKKQDAFRFNVLVRGTFDYPERLIHYDFPLLYYRGDISLVSSPCIAVGGTTLLTDADEALSGNVAFRLVEAGYTVVSGLAHGVESTVQMAAIVAEGRCIGVLDTPIAPNTDSPSINLQETLAHHHLVVSYVPFYRYAHMTREESRLYFPDRSKLVVSLCMATIITALGPSNRTFSLARETVQQGKPLVLCKNVFRAGLQWPEEYVHEHGAHVVETADEAVQLVEALCRIG